MTETDEPDTRRPALWYLAHDPRRAGVRCSRRSCSSPPARDTTAFGDLRAAAAALSPASRDAVFVLALVGFGSKAGIIPLHVWLPRAHPAAPSHVSALMSGVMIKLGVYGLLRVGLDLLGGGPAWWGGAAGRLGAVSARARRALRADGARPQAAARLLTPSRTSASSCIGVGAGFCSRATGCPRWPRSASPPASITRSTTPASRRCSSWARAPSCTRRTRATWRAGRADQAACPGRALLPPRAPSRSRACRRSTASSPSGSSSRRSSRGVGDAPARGGGRHAARGRHARADERPRRGLLRQGVRDHVPRDPALARGRAGARGPAVHADRDGALALACVALGLAPSLVVPVLGGALAGWTGWPGRLVFDPPLPLRVPGAAA